ncbi:hypothetical protein [Gallionella capsiferriformans]|uniref:MAE-28990/MAE-18760-like HEPN domain-containing protein n=1 Tax=Gallionella capsiferriformans (strain ES-2) TaxID=395494 RepID=D9SDI1_GALCS|nr:hypothetical protein [Gallionella capsiferriformans]ADL56779.1 hypothetical protein Galf_2786 [Gallionella capsiferriformans ES-2]
MGNFTFDRQYTKLKLRQYVSDIEHCKKLSDTGYYTESFIAMWILVEVIAKNIQITYRASIVAENISGSLLRKLLANHVDIEKNGLRIQLIDISFYKAKEMYGSRREYIDVGDVIFGLKLSAPDADEQRLRFLLASKIAQAPTGFSSRTTIREIRNGLVHSKCTISKENFIRYQEYFDYFFSLTVHKEASAPAFATNSHSEDVK